MGASNRERRKELFDPVVREDRRDRRFEHARTWPGAEPGRLMANEIYRELPEPDGNFVEQFQSTGFDARVFELYLYAYFSRSRFGVTRPRPHPDFLVTRAGTTVAVEATTVNPRPNEKLIDLSNPPRELSPEELKHKLENELPIRFGSPLFSKLNMRYWESPECKDLPLVLAIEAFHEPLSLTFSDSSLAHFLYGLRSFPKWTEDGELYTEDVPIAEHRHGKKVIPSRFFGQPDTENISAVLFSNSGTWAKFQRMGFQAGYQRGNVTMIRRGICFNPDRNSATPLRFEYSLHNPPREESWGQGLAVFHNPNATHPLPHEFFADAAIHYFEEQGRLTTDGPTFHPFTSVTEVRHIKDPDLLPGVEVWPRIRSLLESEFNALSIPRKQIGIPVNEMEWFATDDLTVVGVVVLDISDKDWFYVMFSRGENGRLETMDLQSDIPKRAEGRRRLLQAMEEEHRKTMH